MIPAFRCKNCGYIESAEQAGESLHPHACRVCGSGVGFDPKTGVRKIDPGNWEILADATPERLAELGLTEVAKHEGTAPIVSGRTVEAIAVDGPKTSDK